MEDLRPETCSHARTAHAWTYVERPPVLSESVPSGPRGTVRLRNARLDRDRARAAFPRCPRQSRRRPMPRALCARMNPAAGARSPRVRPRPLGPPAQRYGVGWPCHGSSRPRVTATTARRAATHVDKFVDGHEGSDRPDSKQDRSNPQQHPGSRVGGRPPRADVRGRVDVARRSQPMSRDGARVRPERKSVGAHSQAFLISRSRKDGGPTIRRPAAKSSPHPCVS